MSESVCAGGWESVLPIALHARVRGKTLASIFVCQDAGAGFVLPLVAASVVKMPVSIDQLFDWIFVEVP
jgi:hypothetical protein